MSDAFTRDGWVISPETVRSRLEKGDASMVLLDCRTQPEFDMGHLPGAVHLPMQELSLRQDELDGLQDRDVVIYCRTGRRSRIVARYLTLRGFPCVVSLDGGLQVWSEKIDPSFPWE
ncbi:MAG: rhodanese-like domain-containing protein [Phycisphaerales bacterium]|nr:rhodanese-like domain-containing protein [Phycisphaerales bacterium]